MERILDDLRKHPQLRVLNVSWNDLGTSLCMILDLLHHHPTLEILYANDNNCQVEGARSMAELLSANDRLVEVLLNNNNIRDEGCLLLCNAAKNHPNLQVLNLRDSNLTKVSARALADVLMINRTLRTLWLSHNPCIGDEGAICLFEALLINEHLRFLNLQTCGLTAVCVPALTRFLKSNKTLTKLLAESNVFDSDEVIVDALQQNRVITLFDVAVPKAYSLKTTIMRRNKALVTIREHRCRFSAVTLLGIRKLHPLKSGLLRPMPRDVLRYVLIPYILATRERVEWHP